MTFLFDVNNSTITGAQAIFKLKTLLVTAGWTVKSSGDGLSAFSSSGDIIASGSSGATGLANTNAWFRIQMPLSNGVRREFIWQRGGGNTIWTVKYSYSANFTGGSPSATVLPTATDSQTFLNALTLFTTDSTYRWNAAADNAAPYGVWMSCFPTGGGNPNGGAFAMFPMITGSYQSADVDPYTFYLSSSSSAWGGTDLSSNIKFYHRKGLTGEAFLTLAGAIQIQDSSNTIFPNGAGANPHDGYDNIVDIPFGQYAQVNTWPLGFKGISSMVKWNGTTRSTGDTLSTTGAAAKDRICMRDVNLPWNGSTPTV